MASNGTKLSFSFGGPPQAGGGGAPKSNMEMLLAKAKGAKGPSKPIMFGDDDDEDDDSAPTASSSHGLGPGSSKPKMKPVPSRPILEDDDDGAAGPSSSSRPPPSTTAAPVSRAERRLQSQALAVDSTVFDYDGVYDSLKAAERKLEEIKKAADADKQPKFMHQAIAAAKRRELDRFRAEQKMAQREREKEGEEFQGTEMFVTEAYKRQQEEVERAAEEERKYEEEVRKGQRGSGMSGFYKNMLDDGEEKHQAAVNAAGTQPSGPSLAIRPPTRRDEQYEPEAEYDPFLAREATTTGPSISTTTTTTTTKRDNEGQVEINDDGEVVDKRSLLKAGLNIMKKPKSDIPSLLAKTKSQPLEGPYKSRAVGTAASYTERMERERRRLETQMKEQEEKKRLEEQQRAREEEEAARKRREGDDGEAERKRQEAKERFLARKRAREQGGESEAKKLKGDEE